MALARRLTESRNIRAAVVLPALWVVSVIVNGKEAYHDERTEKLENRNLERRFPLDEERTHQTPNSTIEISERFLLLKSLFVGFTNFVKKAVLGWLEAKYVYDHQGQYTCYRNICFNPENGLGLAIGGPVNPKVENTTFIFFDKSSSNGTEVNETTWEAFLSGYEGDISQPLIAIVHGLNGSRHSPWAVTLRESLFANVNCNILVVDWKHRATIPFYAKAASSSILVGVLLSFMLQTMIQASNCSLHPDNVHIVGFSLGAHAAGVCGRHFYNTTGFQLGRITGLDPAGPLFEHSNVSLSLNDAQFVDVIHTNAGNFSEGKFGLNESIGHVDFYPNGGSDQPNCSFPSESSDPGCSHKRAQFLFIESIYTNCSFKSYNCTGGWNDYVNGSCTKQQNISYIGRMGFYSINETGRGNQYLKTNGAPPYCIKQTQEEKAVVIADVKEVSEEQMPQKL